MSAQSGGLEQVGGRDLPQALPGCGKWMCTITGYDAEEERCRCVQRRDRRTLLPQAARQVCKVDLAELQAQLVVANLGAEEATRRPRVMPSTSCRRDEHLAMLQTLGADMLH